MIGFSGLGKMGGAIAIRMREQGAEMIVYDVSPPVRDRFRSLGFKVAGSVTEMASAADAVLLCLPDHSAVERTATEIAESAHRPALLIDLTSSVPSVTRHVGAQLERRGIGMVDAPVSGGVSGAREGRLTVMAGGSPDLVEKAAVWLRPIAARVLWAGGLGSGHAVKAINNSLSATSLTVTSEMLVTAVRRGADAEATVAAFNSGAARSQNSEVKFPEQILTRRFGAGFTAGLMLKDVSVACRMADEAGAVTPLLDLLRERWAGFVDQAGSEADFTRIQEAVESAAGTYEPTAPNGSGESDAAVAAASAAVALTCAVAGCEMINLARDLDLDTDRVLAVINVSSGRSEFTRSPLWRTPAGHDSNFGMSIGEAEKRMSAASRLAQTVAVSSPVATVAADILKRAGAEMGADAGIAEVAGAYARWSDRHHHREA